MQTTIAADPELSAMDTLLKGTPGAGPVLRATLLALLPELGQLGGRQIAVAEQISTARSPSPYQLGTVTRIQRVSWWARTSARFGRRAPLVRGRPTIPGLRGGAGSYSAASSRKRVMPMRPCRAKVTRNSKAAKLLSPRSTISRPGSQRRA